jgi:hypothetical protein
MGGMVSKEMSKELGKLKLVKDSHQRDSKFSRSFVSTIRKALSS